MFVRILNQLLEENDFNRVFIEQGDGASWKVVVVLKSDYAAIPAECIEQVFHDEKSANEELNRIQNELNA